MSPVEVVETKFGPKTLHVCKDGEDGNTDWVSVYEVSFPPGQRQDVKELENELVSGVMELDETRDQDGNILCMTITEVFREAEAEPPFLLACYTAVVPEMRGQGIGSIHRRKLGELLEDEYPSYLGIFSEIESTRETGIDAAAMNIRVRRKAFFMRLGLIPLDIDYYFPSYVKGEQPIAGELLWVPFGDASISRETLSTIVSRIYVEGYKLAKDDPLIGRVTQSIGKGS